MIYLRIIMVFLFSGLLFLTNTALAQRVKPIKVNPSTANAFRDSLKLKIFGTTQFPYDILPESVETNVSSVEYYTTFPYSSIMYPAGNLDSVDLIQVKFGDNEIDFPLKAKVYLFHPHNSNGKLFIYHSGHCAATAVVEDLFVNGNGVNPGLVIPTLLAQGYTVLAVPMLNYKTIPPSGYTCGYNGHDQLFVEGHYAYPLAFFFKPLIASLNKLGRSNFSSIYMCGLSGGGWTTSLYPAIDSSISYSFPVAGSWPVSVMAKFYGGGDYEQTYPPIYSRLLDYHEIYTLNCLDPARKMLQINNRYDNCCYAGSEAHIFYVDSVAKALEGTGGLYKFYLDETEANHVISKRALEVMLTFIDGQSGSLLQQPQDTIVDEMQYYYNMKNNFVTNTAPDQSALKYSLLKGPQWMQVNQADGSLQGIVPVGNVVSIPDSISFKVEDSTGRFVVYNYNMKRKRNYAYFFTGFNDHTTVYFLPPFSGSIESVSQSAISLFTLNNPALSILDIAVENNSLIRMRFNQAVTVTDLIGYEGTGSSEGIVYNNGHKLEDFPLTRIKLNAVQENVAVEGMIRFNTTLRKFEYFNGTSWIMMH